MAAAVVPFIVDLLFEFPTLNGGEWSMLSVLRELTERQDLHFRAWCPADGPLAEALHDLLIPVQDFEVRDAAGRRRSKADLIEQLLTICHEQDVQLLHANSLSLSRLLGQLPPEKLPPGMFRTGHLRDIIGLTRKSVADLSNNDALVAVSAATKAFHVQQGLHIHHPADDEASGCVVIHNGIDTQRFHPRDRSNLRTELLPEIPADSVVVLNVGQICLRKAQLDVAEAVVSLNNAGREIHLVIAGERHSSKDESIAFEHSVHNTFHAVERSHQLHMLGYRCDINRLMNAADLLVHSARQEPFGRVLLEASASGLPIVATDVGGTREILRPEIDALLVPAKQPTALATAIDRLLTSPQLAARLATSALSRTTEHFTVAHSANALLVFWRDVVNGDHTGVDT